jgi:hypothetical protein
MKTLVIHPKDVTTDFLNPIYSNRSWTVINSKVSHKAIKAAIKEHERIVMLGHGTEQGLLGFDGYGFAINSSMVYALRNKLGVYIWCNAHVFVRKHNLKGFYTGMFISERDEAMYCAVYLATDKHVSESNTLFANCVKNAIDSTDMLGNVLKSYNEINNPVVNYNRDRLFCK